MAFKQMYDLKNVLILMLIGISFVASTNIDCNGKSFHCVNSTHFMICVDLGGGISTTVDDFVISCPKPTQCRETNRFECEFPPLTTTMPPTPLNIATNDIDFAATTPQWESVTTMFPRVTSDHSDIKYTETQTVTSENGTETNLATESVINSITDEINTIDVTDFLPATKLTKDLNGTATQKAKESEIKFYTENSIVIESTNVSPTAVETTEVMINTTENVSYNITELTITTATTDISSLSDTHNHSKDKNVENGSIVLIPTDANVLRSTTIPTLLTDLSQSILRTSQTDILSTVLSVVDENTLLPSTQESDLKIGTSSDVNISEILITSTMFSLAEDNTTVPSIIMTELVSNVTEKPIYINDTQTDILTTISSPIHKVPSTLKPDLSTQSSVALLSETNDTLTTRDQTDKTASLLFNNNNMTGSPITVPDKINNLTDTHTVNSTLTESITTVYSLVDVIVTTSTPLSDLAHEPQMEITNGSSILTNFTTVYSLPQVNSTLTSNLGNTITEKYIEKHTNQSQIITASLLFDNNNTSTVPSITVSATIHNSTENTDNVNSKQTDPITTVSSLVDVTLTPSTPLSDLAQELTMEINSGTNILTDYTTVSSISQVNSNFTTHSGNSPVTEKSIDININQNQIVTTASPLFEINQSVLSKSMPDAINNSTENANDVNSTRPDNISTVLPLFGNVETTSSPLSYLLQGLPMDTKNSSNIKKDISPVTPISQINDTFSTKLGNTVTESTVDILTNKYHIVTTEIPLFENNHTNPVKKVLYTINNLSEKAKDVNLTQMGVLTTNSSLTDVLENPSTSVLELAQELPNEATHENNIQTDFTTVSSVIKVYDSKNNTGNTINEEVNKSTILTTVSPLIAYNNTITSINVNGINSSLEDSVITTKAQGLHADTVNESRTTPERTFTSSMENNMLPTVAGPEPDLVISGTNSNKSSNQFPILTTSSLTEENSTFSTTVVPIIIPDSSTQSEYFSDSPLVDVKMIPSSILPEFKSGVPRGTTEKIILKVNNVIPASLQPDINKTLSSTVPKLVHIHSNVPTFSHRSLKNDTDVNTAYDIQTEKSSITNNNSNPYLDGLPTLNEIPVKSIGINATDSRGKTHLTVNDDINMTSTTHLPALVTEPINAMETTTSFSFTNLPDFINKLTKVTDVNDYVTNISPVSPAPVQTFENKLLPAIPSTSSSIEKSTVNTDVINSSQNETNGMTAKISTAHHINQIPTTTPNAGLVDDLPNYATDNIAIVYSTTSSMFMRSGSNRSSSTPILDLAIEIPIDSLNRIDSPKTYSSVDTSGTEAIINVTSNYIKPTTDSDFINQAILPSASLHGDSTINLERLDVNDLTNLPTNGLVSKEPSTSKHTPAVISDANNITTLNSNEVITNKIVSITETTGEPFIIVVNLQSDRNTEQKNLVSHKKYLQGHTSYVETKANDNNNSFTESLDKSTLISSQIYTNLNSTAAEVATSLLLSNITYSTDEPSVVLHNYEPDNRQKSKVDDLNSHSEKTLKSNIVPVTAPPKENLGASGIRLTPKEDTVTVNIDASNIHVNENVINQSNDHRKPIKFEITTIQTSNISTTDKFETNTQTENINPSNPWVLPQTTEDNISQSVSIGLTDSWTGAIKTNSSISDTTNIKHNISISFLTKPSYLFNTSTMAPVTSYYVKTSPEIAEKTRNLLGNGTLNILASSYNSAFGTVQTDSNIPFNKTRVEIQSDVANNFRNTILDSITETTIREGIVTVTYTANTQTAVSKLVDTSNVNTAISINERDTSTQVYNMLKLSPDHTGSTTTPTLSILENNFRGLIEESKTVGFENHERSLDNTTIPIIQNNADKLLNDTSTYLTTSGNIATSVLTNTVHKLPSQLQNNNFHITNLDQNNTSSSNVRTPSTPLQNIGENLIVIGQDSVNQISPPLKDIAKPTVVVNTNTPNTYSLPNLESATILLTTESVLRNDKVVTPLNKKQTSTTFTDTGGTDTDNTVENKKVETAPKTTNIITVKSNNDQQNTIVDVTLVSIIDDVKETDKTQSMQMQPIVSTNSLHTTLINVTNDDSKTASTRRKYTNYEISEIEATTSNNATKKSISSISQKTPVPELVTRIPQSNATKAADKLYKKSGTKIFDCLNRKRGRYADKEHCRKFYICSGRPQPIIGLCPVNTVFSESRTLCTKNLSHCIRNNQFQCASEGRYSDHLKQNVYYICVKNTLNHFVRFKFQCQLGYLLNKTTVRCEQEPKVINTSVSNDSISKSTVDKKSREGENRSKSRSQSEKDDFECDEEGKFPDPNNCRRYFVCSKRNDSNEYRRKRKKCDSDELFHKDKKKCVDAESYECS